MPTILDLLMALNRGDLPPVPAPAIPMSLGPLQPPNTPEYGGPSQVVEPPQAPLDTRIIQQMLALRGPAPTAPAPPSGLGRILNAIAGFGAGVQGQGPQFLAQLQEPQRRYEQQLSAYNNLGTELSVRGLETAQRQQEQKTRRAQEVADQQFEAEVRRETRRLNLTDQREMEMFRDTLLAKRQREDDERAAEETRRREKAQRERDAIKLEGELIQKDGASQSIAREIARRTAGLSDAPLSAAAEKWRGAQANLAQARAERLARIGAGGRGGEQTKAVAELADGSVVPLTSQVAELIKAGMLEAKKVYVPGAQPKAAGAAAPTRSLTDQFINPGYVESLFAPAPTQGAPSDAEVKAYAKRFRMSPKKARAELMGQ